jgi:homogentisate phytyltransferase/homogentisate geranylgeranyltransferase
MAVGGALQVAAPRRLAAAVGVLWRFSRPHTVIGTTLSILGLYVIAATQLPGAALGEGLGDLFCVLVAGFCVNVAIVGVNQITDVAIDRINKPFLPIAAGELSLEQARWIVLACTLIPLALAVTQGLVEIVSVSAALLVGAAYSLPPLRLKRFPALAAASITVVRSVVVNVGVALHFSSALAGGASAGTVPGPAWALTAFVLPFSFAIAVLKDVPDLEGDRAFRIRTLTVRLGGRRVLAIGMAALTLAYAGMAVLGPLLLTGVQPVVLTGGHVGALALLWVWAARTDTGDRAAFTRFYLRVWMLFFLEYPLVALACLAG